MYIGDYDDVQMLAAQAGDDYLRKVLAGDEIGQYSARSWAYWHCRCVCDVRARVPAERSSQGVDQGGECGTRLPPATIASRTLSIEK